MSQLSFLHKSEQKVYIASLRLGSFTILDLTRATGYARSSLYNTVERLVSKGLLTCFSRGKRRYYTAVSPARLQELLLKHEQVVREDQIKLLDLLPSLEKLFFRDISKPKVEFFQGIQGVRQVYKDTLKQSPGSEILAYASADHAYEYLSIFLEQYIKERVEGKISVRAILVDTPKARLHFQSHSRDLLYFKFIPKKFAFTPEVNIYKNKVAFMSYGHDPAGVIIHSQDIYNYHKQIFELLWSRT